jgi:hypothetical protein
MSAAPFAPHAPRQDVREGVRSILTAAENFHALDEETRRAIARSLVKIGSTAQTLTEDMAPVHRAPLSLAQNAGSEYSGVATDRLAQTTQNVLNAVSFPRFVTELISGVFKAMNDSNQQQMSAYVDLIRNVASSTEGFADANFGMSGARAWLAERFPGSYQIEGAEPVDPADTASMTSEERAETQAERDAETRLILRPGGARPSEAALRSALGIGETEAVPAGNPEALVGLARAALARNRQQTLATMVRMGLQRIVIESGKLNASMRFHIDTRSAANSDRGSQFDLRNTTEVGVNGRVGIWGAEAKMQNTIGYVSTDRNQSSEETNTDLNLDSSVELHFKSDYVPLNHLAGPSDAARIRANSINPEADAEADRTDRTGRVAAQREAEAARRATLDERLHTPELPPPMSPIAPRTAPTSEPTASAPAAAPVAAALAASSPASVAAVPAVAGPVTGTPAVPTPVAPVFASVAAHV